MDAKEIISEKENCYDSIQSARTILAKLIRDKAEMKAPLWEEATGTVDAKKDYIKSKTSEIDENIAIEEANIEHYYNMIDILNDKLAYCCDLFEEE